MKKTVSEKQIERLFQFTREHYVEHYDLQSELVDHLANAIEQRWEEIPEQPFEDCIKAEFKKFGIFGFMEVVEKHQNILHKKYRKFVWKQIATFLQLPKILFTGSLIFLLYFIVLSGKIGVFILLIISFLTVFLTDMYLRKLRKSYKKRIAETGKKWYLEEYIFNFATTSGTSFLFFGTYFTFFAMSKNWTIQNPYVLFLLCFGIVVYLIRKYILLFYLPKNAEKYLAATYPEYKLAS